MLRKIFTLKHTVLGIIFLLLDVMVYASLDLILCVYDAYYTKSKGPYWSLESMTSTQKITYIGLNFWHLVNLFALGFLVYKVIGFVRANLEES